MGTGKTVTATVAINAPNATTNVDAGNYSLANVNASATNAASYITARALVVAATGINKVYDGLTTATVNLSDNRVSGDVLTTAYTTATFANADAETNKVVSVNVISISGDDAGNYTANTSAMTTATITPNNSVKVTYTGAVYSSTSAINSSKATVTLSATVQDMILGSAGDIRTATVGFYIVETSKYSNGETTQYLPVGLVNFNSNDLKNGTATFNWTADIGSADSKQFTVKTVVNGNYSYTGSEANTVITVSKPLDSFVTGGGYIVIPTIQSGAQSGMTASAGKYAADGGSKANFGFNIKYNKSGTNLQGNINTIIRRTKMDQDPTGAPGVLVPVVHVYQIKGNVMSSLAVQAATASSPDAKATFNGQANIQDITTGTSESVEGNASLQVTMTDKGEPGTSDGISITVWHKDGGLLFASDWSGSITKEDVLAKGNLVVRGGSYNSGTKAITTTSVVSSSTNNTSTLGSVVTFTAKVASQTTGTPTGTVSFLEGNTVLGNMPLNTTATTTTPAGSVTFTTSALSLGTHTITVVYSGDVKFASSTTTITQEVTGASARSVLAATTTSTSKVANNLLEVYPNPMAVNATIHFHTEKGGKAQVYLYDQLGRLVSTLYNAEVQSGQEYYVPFNRELLADGVYFCRLISNGKVENQRINIVR
ncbi:hypothetical protein BEN48_16275 [Hymenobacter glacialis]|uniref:Secretion system C-terminal sorting domain-containing protein n=1 Tax=Hymenobacter glacialis TaxID=1908236 RepID=A0A1G1T079_9BACT|nr:hypothetical protein BEN48_16275 [Hymenobacter glacialis]